MKELESREANVEHLVFDYIICIVSFSAAFARAMAHSMSLGGGASDTAIGPEYANVPGVVVSCFIILFINYPACMKT